MSRAQCARPAACMPGFSLQLSRRGPAPSWRPVTLFSAPNLCSVLRCADVAGLHLVPPPVSAQVRPLRRQLTGLKAWITGQRKDQSPGTRQAVPVVQVGAGSQPCGLVQAAAAPHTHPIGWLPTTWRVQQRRGVASASPLTLLSCLVLASLTTHLRALWHMPHAALCCTTLCLSITGRPRV